MYNLSKKKDKKLGVKMVKKVVRFAAPKILKSAKKTVLLTSIPVIAQNTAELVKTKLQNCNRISKIEAQHQEELAQAKRSAKRNCAIIGASSLLVGAAIGFAVNEAAHQVEENDKK